MNKIPECMNMIIGWEYARMWLRERDEFRKLRDRAAKPQFIENDYEWWLKLRKTNKRFCCIT
ncbi:uncharacterized protein LOC115626142 isoform X2 [Scaptodrosophila lebanonensis]|uniref:Uncharacterized protein LOC115626142 isoform X2 n=1 Tax=Drosophila lebanonensis TaxID=7225 RepID=A0A6J2TP21_DROLE|nr:uncharacterized protein LOC115626142 isoform X2 [Scaptodrosophila lebanonensis]